MIWHSEGLNDVTSCLKTDGQKGLSNSVAQERLQTYGSNSLSFGKVTSFTSRFFAQFNNFTVIALLAVALVSLIVTVITDDRRFFPPILIFATVIIDAAVTAYEEIKSEDVADVLKDISAPTATVIREGITKVVDASCLVPGDIIVLNEGDYISADARLLSAQALCCDESPLTGLYVPVSKNADAVFEDITPLGERANMVYSGCSVTHGTATVVVVSTGVETELGKERTILEQTGTKRIPVKDSVFAFAKVFSTVTLVACLVVFAVSMIYNFRNPDISRTLIDNFLDSVALAVAVIPEGIPTAVAVIITLGAQRLITKDILVKDLSSVETMGCVSVICADKTGTLTENRMTAVKVFNGRETVELDENVGDDVKMILELATICNNSSEAKGDPTGMGIAEACVNICKKSKIDIDNLYPRLEEVPFDSQSKLMTTVNMINGKPFAIVKGAPESLLPLCVGNCLEKYTPAINEMAEDALRVIAVAAKPIDEVPANPSAEEFADSLNFMGLIGLSDNPRAEAVRAVYDCKKAGIRTVMVTGDHPATAKAFGRRLGILTDDTQLITGAELDVMTDEELAENIEKYSVYARISGADRLRIVKAWQKNGACVSVTGDSVDDTPALMAADVGCAMGKTGTDVAKGVSDIIITDDDFSSVVNSVKEGRAIYSNIRKVLNYLISSNLGELLLMLAGVIIFGDIPLTAAQLLWVNLITDIIPVIAIGMEPPEAEVMLSKPQRRQTLFSKTLITSIVYQAVIMGVLSLVTFGLGNSVNSSVASTMVFAVVILSQIFFSLSARTENAPSVFSFKNNKTALLAGAVSVALLLFIMLSPLNAVFSLSTLRFSQWMTVLGLSVIPFVVCEVVKFVKTLKKQ